MVKKTRYNISDAEWEVMKTLWKKSPLTSNEVVKRLSGGVKWHPNTIKTMLDRLVAKRVLGYDKRGRERLFSPLRTEAECVQEESDSFLKRVFAGAVRPMMAHFVKNQKLTPEDIRELKQILRSKGK